MVVYVSKHVSHPRAVNRGKRQHLRARVRAYFRRGFDTSEIASAFSISEALAYNLLHTMPNKSKFKSHSSAPSSLSGSDEPQAVTDKAGGSSPPASCPTGDEPG